MLISLALWAGLAGSRVGALPSAAPQATNLLANPGFEGQFTIRADPYTGQSAPELGVAEGWELWYDNNQVCPAYASMASLRPAYVATACNPESYNRRPEYKEENGTFRVRSGNKAQKFFTSYSTHTAGIWQRVNVPPGSWISFSIWVQTWSSDRDEPYYSIDPGYYAVSVGIDPTGGNEWNSPNIVWSKPITRHDRWLQLQVSAYTITGQVTVWTRGTQVWPVVHNDSYWDDASLVVLACAPTPTPMDTPTPQPMPTPSITPVPDALGSLPNLRETWHLSGPSRGASWGLDQARGIIQLEEKGLWLRNGEEDWKAFPLAWVEGAWPQWNDLRLSFDFAYENVTGYGTSIGVGSWSYDGERILPGMPDNPRLDDILHIHNHDGGADSGISVTLLGQTIWTAPAGDKAWHHISLELHGQTYILCVDNEEKGRAVSYWHPQSLYVGSPIVLEQSGHWTEVGIANLVLEKRVDHELHIPLIQQGEDCRP